MEIRGQDVFQKEALLLQAVLICLRAINRNYYGAQQAKVVLDFVFNVLENEKISAEFLGMMVDIVMETEIHLLEIS